MRPIPGRRKHDAGPDGPVGLGDRCPWTGKHVDRAFLATGRRDIAEERECKRVFHIVGGLDRIIHVLDEERGEHAAQQADNHCQKNIHQTFGPGR